MRIKEIAAEMARLVEQMEEADYQSCERLCFRYEELEQELTQHCESSDEVHGHLVAAGLE